MDMKSHERRAGEIEEPLALLLNKLIEQAFLLVMGKMTNVDYRHGKHRSFVDKLQGLAILREFKRGTQIGMAGDHFLSGKIKHLGVQFCAAVPAIDIVIGRPSTERFKMIEHTQLECGERIGVFHLRGYSVPYILPDE